MIQIRESETEFALPRRTCSGNERIELRRAEPHTIEKRLQRRAASNFVRSSEDERRRSPSSNGRIDRAIAIGRQHHDYRESSLGEAVEAANEGVDTGAILVVHLRRFSRLSEGVRFVDEKDDGRPGPIRSSVTRTGSFPNLLECCGEELGHLADGTTPTRGKAETVKEDGYVDRTGNRVTEGLGERGLASSDVAGEQEHRRTIGERLACGNAPTVVLGAPLFEARRFEQKPRFLRQSFLDVVQADERLVSVLRCAVGIFEDRFEEVNRRGAHSDRKIERWTPVPPDE